MVTLPYPTNPNLQAVPVYQPGRPIEEVARELGLPADDIVKLASNENPLGPSRRAVAAMRKALAQAHLYPDGNAHYLKQKLAARLGVTPAHLILGNGSNEVIEFLGHALIAPGTEVVMAQYSFAVYAIVTALFGGQLVVVPARNYGHDLDAMRAAITPRTRLVFVANPNNPTGTCVAAADLARFVAAVPENVVIALDEAYFEFLDQPLDLTPEIRAGRKPNLILMRTFSKIYGLPARGSAMASRIRPDCRAGENPPALQHQRHRPGRRPGRARRRGARPKNPPPDARGLRFYARALRRLGWNTSPPPTSSWSASATASGSSTKCSNCASSLVLCASTSCPRGFASPSARPGKTITAWPPSRPPWPGRRRRPPEPFPLS